MPPNIVEIEHVCRKEEVIDEIRDKLNSGTLSFNNVDNRLKNIETVLIDVKEQTTKTNGRVTKIERLALVTKVIVLTTIIMLLFQVFGFWEVVFKLLKV